MNETMEVVWHNDGHAMNLTLNKSTIVVESVHCPGGEDRACKVGQFDCIVTWFLDVYGLECNVGICEVQPTIELAWSAVGQFDDPQLCQVWVIPINDEAFSAWLIMQG